MLVLKNVLSEDMVIGNHDNVICYVKLGPKAMDLLQGRYKVNKQTNKQVNKNERKQHVRLYLLRACVSLWRVLVVWGKQKLFVSY